MRRAAAVGLVVLLALLAACESFRINSPQDVTRLLQQGNETVREIHGAAVDITEPEEVELGRAVTAGVGARYRLLRDEALTRYVALVGNAVAARSDRPDLRYYFAVLDSNDVNAFAAPGGYVFITRGALGAMRDEAMLAGVLGHEVGHIALHHHAQTIKNENTKNLTMKGGQALQDRLGHGKAAPFVQLAQAFGIKTDAVLDGLIVKGPSKTEEMESDAVGFKYAASAGYDPAGLRDFLKAVQERGRGEPAAAMFFSTHPGIEDRLREQETLLKNAAGGRRNVARFERAVLRRGPAIVTPTAITPPAIGPKGAITSQFLQSLTSTGRYVTHAIAFESNSDRFRPESKAAVKEIADALASTPALRVRIEGHTDAQGNPMANMQLSQRRADAVRNVLVTEFGVDVRRVNTIGLGASRPIATNDTPEGRATNRRVEFVREP